MTEGSAKPAQDLKQVLAQLDAALRKKRKPAEPKPEVVYNYRVSLISYIDILGMHDILEKAADDPRAVAEVLEVFKKYSEPDKDQLQFWDMSFRNFSDLAIRMVPILTDTNMRDRVGCFFHEVWDLGYIQANCIHRGRLLRGAMTIGRVCSQNDLIFGPGLADAHQLESKVATFPRIIISDIAMEALKQAPVLRGMGNSFREEMKYLGFIRQDFDGRWFVDYLEMMRTESDSPRQYGDFLETHRKLIEQQRGEVKGLPKGHGRQSRLAKLKWLIALHRSHLKQADKDAFKRDTGREIKDLKVKRWKKGLRKSKARLELLSAKAATY